MGLQWIKLETAMATNPKILKLTSRAEGGAAGFVWIRSICYSAQHGTNGVIAPEALLVLQARPIHVDLLVEHLLWHVHRVGWLIHDFEEYQLVAIEALLERSPAQTQPEVPSNGHGPTTPSERGRARWAGMSAEARAEVTRKAAEARWKGRDDAS